MDEVELDSLVASLMRQLANVFDGGLLLQENAQIVIRPIFTWPDGKLNVWAIVNWPN
jgi:hypothetical protein